MSNFINKQTRLNKLLDKTYSPLLFAHFCSQIQITSLDNVKEKQYIDWLLFVFGPLFIYQSF